jgi:hypothetical protein
MTEMGTIKISVRDLIDDELGQTAFHRISQRPGVLGFIVEDVGKGNMQRVPSGCEIGRRRGSH